MNRRAGEQPQRKGEGSSKLSQSGQLLFSFGPSLAAAEALAASCEASFALKRRAFRRMARATKAQKGGVI